MGGNLAGYHQGSREEDGTYKFVFEFNDRGRGPHLEERVRLGDDGVIHDLKTQGHNYLKDTVNEIFTFDGSTATWNSSSESGTRNSDGGSFYSAVNSTFGSTELLMRKLLTIPDRSVDLLPGGTARITDTKDILINDTLGLSLLEVTGFSFTPTYVWMDKRDRFFASVSSWFSCIRSGYDSLGAQLLEIQTEKELAYYKTLAERLTEVPSGLLAIKNVNVFDVREGIIEKNKTVIISGNKISHIIPAAEDIPEVTNVIDGTGKTLIPGLFDMHGHLFRPDGILDIAAGVTSVRDLANSLDLLNIKAEFDNNEAIGPRILVMCGFIDQAGPYAGPIGKIVSTLEEGLEAVQFYKDKGYQQIKLYSSIDPDWVKPLTDRAHELGMRVSGHIPAYMLASQAVEHGYDEIQHVNMLALNFLPDTIDTRTPLRFSMVAEHTHALNLKGREFRAFIELLRKNNTVIDPTVSFFEGMFCTKAGEPDPQFVSVLDRLPVQVKRRYYSGGLPIPEGKEEQYRNSYNKLLDIIYELYSNGITIVPGTDAMAGFALHKKLENYVKAGIPEAEVLKMATIISAEVIGVDDKLGAVEAGMLADLVLLDGDPLEDISVVRRVDLTIKDGNIYRPDKLYEAIGVGHYK